MAPTVWYCPPRFQLGRQTFPGRFQARMTPYCAIGAWTKATLISLVVFGLFFFGPEGGPNGPNGPKFGVQSPHTPTRKADMV